MGKHKGRYAETTADQKSRKRTYKRPNTRSREKSPIATDLEVIKRQKYDNESTRKVTMKDKSMGKRSQVVERWIDQNDNQNTSQVQLAPACDDESDCETEKNSNKIRTGIFVSVPGVQPSDEELDYEDTLDPDGKEKGQNEITPTEIGDSEIEFNFKEKEDAEKNERMKLLSLLKDPEMRSAIKDVITDIEKEKQSTPKTTHRNPEANKDKDRIQMRSVINRVDNSKKPNPGRSLIKSPSDTTVYAPALIHRPSIPPNFIHGQGDQQNSYLIEMHDEIIQSKQIDDKVNNVTVTQNGKIDQTDQIDQIANFIEGIRMQTTDRGGNEKDKTQGERNQQPRPGTSKDDGFDDARSRADLMVIEVEKYKASMINPAGNNFSNTQRQSDDEFFHLTCHIDDSLKAKIEKGEFVELECLLPKDRYSARHQSEGKMEIVNKDGQMYFTSAKEVKINSIRRWEQAFRVYVAIYSAANPSRSYEIWQYVYVINSAAAGYQWENVSYYDYTLRQLMARNPQRSWANMYLQMWNLAMRDPITRNTGGQIVNYQSRGSNNSDDQNQNGGRKRTKYCWKFNKMPPCPDGRNCKFPHRCYFCDGYNHGINICTKREKKEQYKRDNDYKKNSPKK